MITLTLTLTLGTEHMRSGDDVQRALALTGAEIANRYDGLDLPLYIDGKIHDSAGRPVGQWHIDQEES